jgi:hypothetical protein
VDVISSLYLTNNKASSYWYVQGDAGYDKYTYVNQRQAFSRPVPSRLQSGARDGFTGGCGGDAHPPPPPLAKGGAGGAIFHDKAKKTK